MSDVPAKKKKTMMSETSDKKTSKKTEGDSTTKKKKTSTKEGGEEKKTKKSSTTDTGEKKKKKSAEDAPKKRAADSDEEDVATGGAASQQELQKKDDEIKSLKSELETEKKKLHTELDEIKKQHETELAKLKAELASAQKSEKHAEKADDSNVITTEPKTGKTVKINAEWKGTTAGGCMNGNSWRFNPQIFIRPSRTTTATITIQQPPASTLTAIGWYIFEAETNEARRLLTATDEDILLKSGFSKSETTPAKTFELRKGTKPYVLLPCTLNAGDELKFSVTIEADAEITAQLISKDQEWPQPIIMGEWAGETAGGCTNHESFPKNPQYLMKIDKQTPLKILLLQEQFPEFDNISCYVVEVEPDRTQKITERSAVKDKSKVVIPAEFGDGQVFTASATVKPGTYAIIPSTFDKGQEAPFKLMVLADHRLAITELQDAACLSVSGTWSGETAGGCLNDVRAWRGNTQYLLSVTQDVEVTIKVKQTSIIGGTDLASVGFYIFTGGKRILRPKKKNIFHKSKFIKKSDGFSQKVKLPASEEPYIIVPCTFTAGQEGNFSLNIYSDDPNFVKHVQLGPIPQSRDVQKFVSKGEWEGPSAGGCLNYATWRNNPQFLLDVSKTCEITIFLTCKTDKEDMKPGFYVVNAPTNSSIKVDMKKGEPIVLKCPFQQGLEVVKSQKFEPGRYNLIPCTYDYASESKFEVSVYASEFGAVEFKPIPAGLLSVRGEWTPETAGGCINDVKSWFTNPHFYIAVKQHTEVAAVLVQSPGEDNLPADQLLEIGFYITNSDGEGKPKINEAKDLIANSAFAPDKDSVTVITLPASHWPYVLTPCTFKAGLTGKFEITLLMDKESLEFVEFSKDPIVINPAEVVGAGEDPAMRELRRRFKPLSSRTLELVQFTESTNGLPEHLRFVGRTLLQTVAQMQDSIVAWSEETEPAWWTEGYDEEYTEEAEVGTGAPAPPPPPPEGGPPPPPPPPKMPPINFSKPVRTKMVDTNTVSSMTTDMIEELENKQQVFLDELLIAVQGGLKNLKKVEPVVKPPPPTNTFDCAFNLEILNKRRAAIEGLNDKPEDDWDDGWSDAEAE